MNIIKGLIIAFAMFSRIPMPTVKWEESNLKYVFCFFPFIGLVVGGINILWYYIAQYLELNNIFFAAVATLIPLLITGGIHFDGYMDTKDALSSNGDKKKLLEILDDSHIGAFSVISAIAYFILYFAAMTEIDSLWQMVMLLVGFFMIRATAVCIILSSKLSKDNGLLYTFKNGADRAVTTLFTVVYIMFAVGSAETINIAVGLFNILVVVLSTLYFVKFVAKKFGGISGDLIGYFISFCELAVVLVTAIGGAIL